MTHETLARFPAISAAIGFTAGAVGLLMHRYSRLRDDQRSDEMFRELDTTTMTARQIWDEALKLQRTERTELRQEILALEVIAHESEAVTQCIADMRRLVELQEQGIIPPRAYFDLQMRASVRLLTAVPGIRLSGVWDERVAALRAELPEDSRDRTWAWILTMAGAPPWDRRERAHVWSRMPEEAAHV